MKFLRILSGVVIIISLLSIYGYVVKEHVNRNSEHRIYALLEDFISIPAMVKDVLVSKEIQGIPPTFEAALIADTFNYLDEEVYGLITLYNQETKNWDIELLNFKDDSIHHTWNLNRSNFNKTDREWANAEPRNPILLPGRELIAHNDETKNLYKLNTHSEIVWHNREKIFHHSLNLDHAGNIWVCTGELKKIQIPQRTEAVVYEDDYITKIDSETGDVLLHKSTTQIFLENDLRGFVFGMANGTHSLIEPDPLHLNDIEPIIKDGPFWNQGDLLLSFRNRSCVVQYRPGTNEIIRLIQGPFLQQHDVDILSDSVISVFNNGSTNLGTTVIAKWKWENLPLSYTDKHSNIVHYNFSDSSFSVKLENHFSSHEIFSMYQGFHHHLENGLVYVEDYTDGIMFFMSKDSVFYKKQSPNTLDTLVENPHWVRIYEHIDF